MEEVVKAYQKSKYVHAVRDPKQDRWVLYSFLTGKIVTMTDLQMMIYENAPYEELSSDFLRDLYDAGFLTDKEEYEILTERQKKRQAEDKDVHLLICPTMGCNFSCAYCIETGQLRNGRMDTKTEEAVADFVKKLCKTADATSLSIIWFGGEPLLEPGIIERISKELIEFCDENRILYLATVYSNGYFLTEKNIRMLEEGRVGTVRISVDGSKKSHDAMRYLKGGQGSYETILNHLKTPTKITYRIRCNLNRSNKDEYVTLVSNLKEVQRISGNTIIVTPERMRVEKSVSEELNKIELPYPEYYEIYQILKDLKVSDDPDAFRDGLTGKKHGQVCNGVRKYSFCIDEKGNLYKCNWYFGMEEHVIGNVFSDSPETLWENPETKVFMNNTVTKREKCRNCEMLPVCLGRCMHSWGIEGKYDCNRYIDKLDETVLRGYENMLQRAGESE